MRKRMTTVKASVKDLQAQAAQLASQAPDVPEVKAAFLAHQASALQAYAPAVADWRITVAEIQRQAYEDHRANRRNRNRLLTIIVGLVASLLVPTILLQLPASVRLALVPFTIAFIVVPDVLVTAYALWRKL